MPSADFCSAIRMPRGRLSRRSDTEQISRGHFSRYFHRRSDQLGPEHIRQYQAMLFSKLKLDPNTVTAMLLAGVLYFILRRRAATR